MGIHHSWGQEMKRIFLFAFFPFLSLQGFGLLKQAVDILVRIGWRRDVNEALYIKAFMIEEHTAKSLVHNSQIHHLLHLKTPRTSSLPLC